MMSRRSIVLAALLVVPVLIYVGLGAYALWQTGVLTRVWWWLPAVWAVTWILSKIWQPPHTASSSQHAVSISTHWTPRDEQAAEIVRAYQQKVDQCTPAQLTDFQFYQKVVQELAVDLARHYHPDASDPFTSLTVPEVIAAVRLAVDDLEQWLLTSVPGSRLLSINQWRMLQHAPKWWRRIQDTTWAASILINPLNIARYFSSKLSLDPVTTELQSELLAALYLRFIRQLGFYLIEMNSGRLRGGADAYRHTFQPELEREPARAASYSTPSRSSVLYSMGTRSITKMALQPVTVALVGQVSAGKSSLINAMTGVHQAAVDILPETRNVQRYQVPVGNPPVSIALLDTPGYGESGASADQLEQIEAALQESNAVLVVMDAHSPAREADRRTIEELMEWYASQPRLKPPPLIGVLTHVDLLRPPLEWSPPYEWRDPDRIKAHSIHDAVAYVRDLFGSNFEDVVPVCADSVRKREWGILEELIPSLTAILNEAQAAALLRGFEHDLDRGRLRTLLKQLRRSGSDLVRCWIEERLRPALSNAAKDVDDKPA